MKKTTLAKLFLTITSAVVGMYILELALFIFPSLTVTAGWSAIDFDSRSRMEVVDDLRASGVDTSPVTLPFFFFDVDQEGVAKSAIEIDGVEVLPLGGISHKKLVVCNEDGPYLVYDTDEHGFHNPRGLWQAAGLQVAAVGDSFTHGNCVPSNENLVSRIRERYPLTLNLGEGRNGPLIELAGVQEYLPSLKPRVLLWFYFERDLEDLSFEKSSPLLMRYLKEDFRQGLLGKQREIDQAISVFVQNASSEFHNRGQIRRAPRSLRSFLLASDLRAFFASRFSNELLLKKADEEDYELFRNILKKAKETVGSWGGQLHFVYLPAFRRYSNDGSAEEEFDVARRRVLSLVKQLDIPTIDTYLLFAKHPRPRALFSYTGPHYNSDGYRIVADAVLKSISSSF